MSESPCMAVETSRELFATIVKSGIDTNKLASLAKVSREQLEKSEQRFSVKRHLQIWQAADLLIPYSGIGLKMGSESDPTSRGIVGLVFAASPDLKTAVTNKHKYTKILAEHVDLQVEYSDTEFTIVYSIAAEYYHCYEIERVFAGFLNWVRHFVGRKIYPTRVSCQFSKPQHVDAYQKHFNCPLYFDQGENRIAFDRQLLSELNPQFNEYLYSILQARAERVLSQLDNSVDFINGVRSLIAGRLSKGSFSVDTLASVLNMSTRTFYRKLHNEETSYQQLLDDERKKMALSYLTQTDCQLQNIAFMLGYADQKGFSRAFKRWMDCSPSQYIQQQKGTRLQHT